MPAKHVAVLMGGWSAEREVSLSSGKPCAAALESKGYRVTKIDVGRDAVAAAVDSGQRRPQSRVVAAEVGVAGDLRAFEPREHVVVEPELGALGPIFLERRCSQNEVTQRSIMTIGGAYS